MPSTLLAKSFAFITKYINNYIFKKADHQNSKNRHDPFSRHLHQQNPNPTRETVPLKRGRRAKRIIKLFSFSWSLLA
jgi:hypothetical protein